MKDIIDFLLTRKKDTKPQPKVYIDFESSNNIENIADDNCIPIYTNYKFSHELIALPEFIYADIINWFRTEADYNSFVDWLQEVSYNLKKNREYREPTNNYSVLFTTANNDIKIIYLATPSKSHLIYLPKRAVPIKISCSLFSKEIYYNIYSNDVYERIAYKSYALNLIDQISHDNIKRVTSRFEQGIHFTKHIRERFGTFEDCILNGNVGLLTSKITKYINLEDCELKIENELKTTINEIDKSTVIEILHYYLCRYIGQYESSDVILKINSDIDKWDDTDNTTYSYDTSDGYEHGTLNIDICKDFKTKNINKVIFSYKKINSSTIDSFLAFEALNNKLRITLHDESMKNEKTINIDALDKLLGQQLELEDNNGSIKIIGQKIVIDSTNININNTENETQEEENKEDTSHFKSFTTEW